MGQLSVDLSAKIESLRTKNLTKTKTGIPFPRYFTARLESGKTPYDEIHWETRTASIGNDKGSVIFEQRDVEVPMEWSQTATNIVASKYFYGKLGSPERETSVAQLVQRVVDTITDWGHKDGYFKSHEDGENFRLELAHLMLTQKACFNSPVWFNVGVKETRGYGWIYDDQSDRVTKLESGVLRPQCSACFIVSVKDSLESILDLAKTEGMLFKWGSGTGSNLSALREENAVLSGGGRASGPLSFMKGFDAFAGVIKSGGKTRRAAKMVILNVDHPDIEKFIWCKAKEEKKAYTLVEAGLRWLARRRSLQLHLLPERQQLRPRHRRFHGSRQSQMANGGPKPSPPASPSSATRPATSCARSPKPPTSAATPACSSIPPSTAGIPARTPPASTRRIPARNTCSSTIRPAISRR